MSKQAFDGNIDGKSVKAVIKFKANGEKNVVF